MNNEPNISLYGDGSGDDFPVLKAFQQYIDAEQAKARRRLLTVSIVFVVTLISVIAIFSILMIKASNQTQLLNERMLELALKDGDRKVEDAKNAALQEATVKSLNDTLERLQKRIEEQDRKANAAAAQVAKELTEAKNAAPSFDTAQDRRNKESEAKIQKALALLKAEKQKLADEKEKLRQEELERYRREHYPEYYAKKEAAEKSKSEVDLDDDLGAISYFDDEDADEEPEVTVPVSRPKAKVKTPSPSKKPATKSKEIDLNDDSGAIRYFKEADSYTIPVEVKGKRAGWRVPLD